MEQSSIIPRLLASTGDTYCGSIANSRVREYSLVNRQVDKDQDGEHPSQQEVEIPQSKTADDTEANYFKSAQW